MELYQQILLGKALDYIKLKKIPHSKSGKMITALKCPFCSKNAAMSIPNTFKMNCIPCNIKFDLLDIVKATEEDKKELDNESIFNYLKDIFKVDIQTKKDEEDLCNILDLYEKLDFDMTPV